MLRQNLTGRKEADLRVANVRKPPTNLTNNPPSARQILPAAARDHRRKRPDGLASVGRDRTGSCGRNSAGWWIAGQNKGSRQFAFSDTRVMIRDVWRPVRKLIECPACGAQNPDEAPHCVTCRTPLHDLNSQETLGDAAAPEDWSVAPASTPTLPVPSEEAPADLLAGRYEILQLLGRGITAAHQTSPRGRKANEQQGKTA